MTPPRQRLPLELLPLALLLSLPAGARGQGKPETDDLIVIRRGTVPIIVSAPHGGRKAIPGVPPRKGKGVPKFKTDPDTNTAELAEAVAAQLERRLGGKPFVVIAHFARKYLDANRPPEGAYESDKAKPYYDAYHKALADACRAVRKRWGRGLLLDLHGQGAEAEVVFRGTADGKTVKLLLDRFGTAALSGRSSVLGRLERQGYEVIPAGGSKDKEDKRFNGGYTVRTHGSHQKGGIDAIQLEWGRSHRAKEALETTAKDLAAAVRAFCVKYLPEALPRREKKETLRGEGAGAEGVSLRQGEGNGGACELTPRLPGQMPGSCPVKARRPGGPQGGVLARRFPRASPLAGGL
jgi:N-formylglutamate amidohydrolase